AEQPRQQTWFVAGVCARLKDARLAVQRHEQAGRIVGRFGRTDDQEAAGIERVVERARDLLLQLAVEINEEVAARDQVDARERRILEHAVRREQHEVAQLAPYPVMIALVHEEPAQALLA